MCKIKSKMQLNLAAGIPNSSVEIGQNKISSIVLYRMYNLRMKVAFVKVQIELLNHLKLFKAGLLLHTPGSLVDSNYLATNNTRVLA